MELLIKESKVFH